MELLKNGLITEFRETYFCMINHFHRFWQYDVCFLIYLLFILLKISNQLNKVQMNLNDLIFASNKFAKFLDSTSLLLSEYMVKKAFIPA